MMHSPASGKANWGFAMRPVGIAFAVLLGAAASSAAHAGEYATAAAMIRPVPLPPVKSVIHALIKPVPMPPQKHEWQTASASNDVVASFKHNDGSELSVVCNTEDRRLFIAFDMPQAKWTAGQGFDVSALPDSGHEPSPSYGIATAPTQVVLKFDTIFDVWTMGQARDFFKFSVGDFARVFPAANFRSAVDPVLKACGDHW